MAEKAPADDQLVGFFLDYISQHATAHGMRNAAAVHWGVDRRTINRWLDSLRQRRRIGRDVFRDWRDA